MAADFAVMAHRLALINLLNFYLAHPFPAIVGSLLLIFLLIYCPIARRCSISCQCT